jgi:hypothetical protein
MPKYIKCAKTCKKAIEITAFYVRKFRHITNTCLVFIFNLRLLLQIQTEELYRTWGFHGSDSEESRLLGCGAVWVLLEPTLRRKVSPPSSR